MSFESIVRSNRVYQLSFYFMYSVRHSQSYAIVFIIFHLVPDAGRLTMELGRNAALTNRLESIYNGIAE